jgi:hypothetical protein
MMSCTYIAKRRFFGLFTGSANQFVTNDYYLIVVDMNVLIVAMAISSGRGRGF